MDDELSFCDLLGYNFDDEDLEYTEDDYLEEEDKPRRFRDDEYEDY